MTERENRLCIGSNGIPAGTLGRDGEQQRDSVFTYHESIP
jgi:serine/threonine-protein kinase HipA